MLRFPEGFVWGAATAAYQIEGAVREDGRGETIWDRFCCTPGKVWNGETGDVACDHYHRYREDVALMKRLDLRSYRFSIAWSRIFPAGSGRLNQAGLDFYGRLVDELLAAGITPAITLYHWDLPQSLQDRGGWENRETADHFVDYAGAVFRALGDRVGFWITLNEPFVVAFSGNFEGRHAPGKTDFPTAVRVSHTLMVAHARVVRLFRRDFASSGKIGITLNLRPCYPRSGGDGRGCAPRRRLPQPLVPRSRVPRVVPGRHARPLPRQGRARRRGRGRSRASFFRQGGLSRRQLLHPGAGRARRRPAAGVRAAGPEGRHGHRYGLGDLPRGAVRPRPGSTGTTAAPRSTSPRAAPHSGTPSSRTGSSTIATASNT